MQDLNSKLKTMVNNKNVEADRVVKLKEEIEGLKEKVVSVA